MMIAMMEDVWDILLSPPVKQDRCAYCGGLGHMAKDCIWPRPPEPDVDMEPSEDGDAPAHG